jgi:hypothetical protein
VNRFKPYRAGISTSSRQEREASARAFNRQLAEKLNGKLEQPGSTTSHVPVKGNTTGVVVTVEFPNADEPRRVAHGLGHTVGNYEVIRTSEPCSIGDCGRNHDRRGLWLQCDKAGVTADIRVSGPERPEPPPKYLRRVGTRRPTA